MKRLGLLLFALLFSAQALAETSVWVVRNGDAVSYLGGTCHVLRPSDYPLPDEFEQAYANSATLVFEVDIAELSDPASQQQLLQAMLYPPGQSLDQVLSAETYQLLDEYCAAAGLPLASLHQFKPSMIVLTLLGLELQKMGVSPSGVDKFYYERAAADGKMTATLESLSDQIRFLVKMGEGKEDDFIRHSIADLEQTAAILDRLIAAWRTGDVAALEEMIVTDLQREFPELYQMLIVSRNQAWLPQIEALLQTAETEFVLVGAGHLVGEDGLVISLRERGYKVEKLQ